MGNLSFLNNFAETTPEPVESQVRAAMIQFGIRPPEYLQIDGNLYRFPTNDSPGDDSGWYCIHPDGVPAGKFGDWRAGTEQNFRADIGRQLTPAEEMAISRRQEEARRKREADKAARQAAAANTVATVWSDSLGAEDHPYLLKKQVQAHGARVWKDGRLVVPLYDQDNKLASLQYISADGEKRYHPGGRTKGCFCIIGNMPETVTKIYIAEGYATAATVYEETGVPCIAAYSAGNLPDVTGFIRAKFPAAEIIIVADNDASGTGKNYADQAAAKHGATVLMPPQVGQDVNDFRAAGGDVKGLLEPRSTIFDQLGVINIGELPDEYIQPDEIIQDLITSEKLVVVYGSSNSGKTFWVISMAAAISESKPFQGRQVDGGAVVYIAAESPGGVRDRMVAYRKHFNSKLDNLYMVSVPLNFHDDPAAAQKMVTLCREIEQKTGEKVRMVIGDTLARMSAGANENSGEDMGPVMAQFDIVMRETGAAVLVIHHSGKDQAKGARGWSGIQAHIDTEIEVTDENGIKAATVTKQRDGAKGFSLYFKLHVIETVAGKFGDMKTTCVAEPDEDAQKDNPKEKKDPIAAKNRACKDLFDAAWKASGAECIQWGDIKEAPYLTRNALREHVKTIKPDAKEQTLTNITKQSHGQFVLKQWVETGKIRAYMSGWVLIDDLETLSIRSPKQS